MRSPGSNGPVDLIAAGFPSDPVLDVAPSYARLRMRTRELPGEYWSGANSRNVGGRVGVAGIAQRIIRHGALTTAVVVVGGGPGGRAVITSVYAALDIDVDLATAGSLDEDLPGATADAVARDPARVRGRRAPRAGRRPARS